MKVKNRDLALIHILKNKMNMPDDDYRAMLHKAYGVNSSKDLTSLQRKELITIMEKMTHDPFKASPLQIQYIKNLANGYVNHLLSFAGKIINREINNINNLSKQEASKVIDALKRYHRK